MILVTGGLGFIGSNFVELAVEKKIPGFESENFLVLDSETYAGSRSNLSKAIGSGKVELVIGDIRDTKIVENCVAKSTGVIHFAAESHVDRSIENPKLFLETNVMGTFNLLNSVSTKSLRILVVSTDEVYGSIESGSASESYTIAPSSAYSASKASADLIAGAFAKTYGTDVVITRSVNNYGFMQHSEKFIPTIIESIAKNRKIPIYGNGVNIRDWMHVEDHCRGIALAYIYGKKSDVFNFGSHDYFNNLELAKLFLRHFSKDIEMIDFVIDRKGHDTRYSVDFSKAKSELGWEPKRLLRESISELSTWYLERHSRKK